ncbi:phycobilisome degradation protein NblB [Gloeocapsa sp. PCC 73106]|uniref:phycobilisome degradation protein NblB n=1 Tax=Gloeocapsa sp. PCC 73106 TaxID=102232 RepID=UPI0002AC6834|nr:HEAT repeat domain-containing protein [Gloeocapsa sp. PCC 73106]ELR96804.1 HEAT-like repeat protein [Gloeocapsa sp. PCC 73106]
MSITPESVQTLINSSDFGDRIRGINQLGQLDPGVAFEMVQPLITDQNTRIRYAAVSQLDTLGHHDLQLTLKLLRDRLYGDSEADVQAAAADVIGALKLTEAFEDLEKTYHQTSEWLVQLSIIASLGEFGDPRGLTLLEEALSSEYDIVRTAAVGAMGELKDLRALPLLLPLVDDPDWQIRYRLVQAISHLGVEQARTTLEKLAEDPVEAIASAAKNLL